MRQYITASGMVGTDLTPNDIFLSVQQGMVYADALPAGLDIMQEIADNPNVYFRSPELSFEDLYSIFPGIIEQEACIADFAYVSDLHQSLQYLVILTGFHEDERRLGVFFAVVPASQINTYQRTTTIDQLLESL